MSKIVRAYEMGSGAQTHANASFVSIRSMLKMVKTRVTKKLGLVMMVMMTSKGELIVFLSYPSSSILVCKLDISYLPFLSDA